MRHPYTSLQNCWIIPQKLTSVKIMTMQGKNCSRDLVAAEPPLEITIVPHGGFVCTPSIMAMQWILENQLERPDSCMRITLRCHEQCTREIVHNCMHMPKSYVCNNCYSVLGLKIHHIPIVVSSPFCHFTISPLSLFVIRKSPFW